MGAITMRTSRRALVSPSRLQQIVLLSVLFLALYCFLLVPDHSLDSSRPAMADTYYTFPNPHSSSSSLSSSSNLKDGLLPPSLLNNLHLTTSQCEFSFPGLTREIAAAVSKGPFTLRRNPHGLGPTILRIRDGHLYILSRARTVDLSEAMLQHRSATLHQIANALLTAPRLSSPEQVPDTILAFNHEDDPASPSLSYSRPADPSFDGPDKHFFPVPHFSFFAWPVPQVRSFARAAAAASAVESRFPAWSDKDPRAVWRGTTWFNSARGGGRLRHDLVRAARGRPWADVQPLAANGSNALMIEDFCRYRYVIHTEGVTYSGRFQFHQLCASVVVAPPLAWIQHLTHLVRPVFSYQLEGVERVDPNNDDRGGGGGGGDSGSGKLLPYPAAWIKAAWPKEYDPSEANIVFVAPDWSDLESTIAWLERHPKIAEGIAQRQRELFHGGGYFSPAAEMCYWRALLRGWSKVVRTEGQGFEDLEEIPWEEFSLKEIHK
ncbi:uncharacterized protein F4812DRAFT_88899 [Daldinia caldariorum]|uniref:uncharacterized protein n=1 Tax=Daldinia caldariorum TaxID=326644 RepID=UPI002007D094|nr:uncharacterized protein F4812DRAFT_88899 [Daldinia caldariorum]KAI1465927.1 hypothetical protein F4812DRAFT_88899 [Daldinia caldariorum]